MFSWLNKNKRNEVLSNKSPLKPVDHSRSVVSAAKNGNESSIRKLTFNDHVQANLARRLSFYHPLPIVTGQQSHVSIPTGRVKYRTPSGKLKSPSISPAMIATGCSKVRRYSQGDIDNYRYDNLLITKSVINSYLKYGSFQLIKHMKEGMTFQSLIDIVGIDRFEAARDKVFRGNIQDRFNRLGIEPHIRNEFIYSMLTDKQS